MFNEQTVTENGMNCFQPSSYIDLKSVGFANLYPTINNMAANTDRGIIFNRSGIRSTEIKSKKPWIIADILVLLFDWIFAELRTITWVIGKPPIIPLKIFPTPWAFSSLLVGVLFFFGSSLSVASTDSIVSRLPTKAIVKPMI